MEGKIKLDDQTLKTGQSNSCCDLRSRSGIRLACEENRQESFLKQYCALEDMAETFGHSTELKFGPLESDPP